MRTSPQFCYQLLLIALLIAAGCQSPYYADRGAAAGGLLGAGAGAIIGSQAGNAASGAAIGAGLGALAGNVFGTQMDEVAAQNRALIANQLGRQVSPGAATTAEVIAMSQAGVDQQLIVNYVRTSGIAAPATTQDLIYLHQQGVPTSVIQAMQTPQPPATGPGPPVLVEQAPYGVPAFYGPAPACCDRRVGFGVTIHH